MIIFLLTSISRQRRTTLAAAIGKTFAKPQGCINSESHLKNLDVADNKN
jgi:hypothetical protein